MILLPTSKYKNPVDTCFLDLHHVQKVVQKVFYHIENDKTYILSHQNLII